MAEQERPLKTFGDVYEEMSRTRWCDFSSVKDGLRHYTVVALYNDDREEHYVELQRKIFNPSLGPDITAFDIQSIAHRVFTTKSSIEARWAIREAEETVEAAQKLWKQAQAPITNVKWPDDLVDSFAHANKTALEFNRTKP